MWTRFSCLVACLLTLLAADQPAALLAQDSGERGRTPRVGVGTTQLIAGSWFQDLGTRPGVRAGDVPIDEHLWLYPTPDGVFEIFVDAGERAWEGSFGSRFDAHTGEFESRFWAAEVLNELLDESLPDARRDGAAELLSLYCELHEVPPSIASAHPDGERETPSWLTAHLAAIDARLDPAGRQRVETRARLVREALARVEHPGTRIPSLDHRESAFEADGESDHPASYYRDLVADGYLDIAVVGGNSRGGGKSSSWPAIESLRDGLLAQGLERRAFREAEDPSLSTGVVRMLGETIRVRLVAAGGSVKPHRIRRSVAAFVEGLAHADVLIFHGHSNRSSGVYWLSESKLPSSRFQIGLGASRDLQERCHALKTKPYQIIALESCFSFEKYCRPLGRFFDEELADRQGRVGFVGLPWEGYFGDFAPRYEAFLSLLFAGRGARDILERLNSIGTNENTPPMIFRGVLGARRKFLLPPGVEITGVEEKSLDPCLTLVVAKGTDGKTYVSTEIFPQNRPGEIVSIVQFSHGVWGLRDDGRVLALGRGTSGKVVEAAVTARSEKRFDALFRATWRGRDRVWLVTRPESSEEPRKLLQLSHDGKRLVPADERIAQELGVELRAAEVHAP